MTDVIEGVVIEEEVPTALIVVPEPPLEGTSALALMSDDEFETRLTQLKLGRDRIARIHAELMTLDVDYGTIPGTPKPTLYKPGAEKLCDVYGLRADFIVVRDIGDGETTPRLSYRVRCELHVGSLDGPVVGVGNGAGNSWETKHRYRSALLTCPSCGNDSGALMKSKREPEFFCWSKRGGCGSTFRDNDEAITGQDLGRIDNPDPFDLDTTLLKMAEKRAHVDATLRTLAASGQFTQDVEDNASPNVAEQARSSTDQATTQTTRTTAPQQAPQGSGDEPPWPGGGEPDPTPAGTVQPTTTPEASTETAATTTPASNERALYEGKVMSVPEGQRNIRRPDWYTGTKDEYVIKVEVAIKVMRSKHTVMLIGPIGEKASGIAKDDLVTVMGERIEVEWKEGKPKMKQIVNVTGFDVRRDGEPIEAIPPEEADVTPPVHVDSDVEPEQQPLMAPDVRELRQGAQDVEETWGGAVIVSESQQTKKGKTVWVVWVTTPDGQRAEVVVPEARAKIEKVPDLVPGEKVAVAGTWKKWDDRMVLVATSCHAS